MTTDKITLKSLIDEILEINNAQETLSKYHDIDKTLTVLKMQVSNLFEQMGGVV